jgi:hypothetical protein
MKDDETERMIILDLIDSGKINAEEGLNLLKALVSGDESVSPEEDAVPAAAATTQTTLEFAAQKVEELSEVGLTEEAVKNELEQAKSPTSKTQPGNSTSHLKKWRDWWMVPLWIGVGLTVAGGLLMYQARQSQGVGFWFVCASAPMLLGVVFMALAWSSRNAPWLHVRVQQKSDERPRRIALSFPIPIRITAWFLRAFGHKIPHLDRTSADELILALGENTNSENPLYIQVDEGEDGEKVEVYIG